MLGTTFDQAQEFAPLACLVMFLLFARSDLYRDRAQRPGFATLIASLFQVTLVILIYAVIEGHEFSSYYIFYGSLFFALVYVSAFRGVVERLSGGPAARRRLPPPRRARRARDAHRRGRARAARQLGDPAGRLRLAARRHTSNGLRDFGSLEQLERHFDVIDEVLIADPDVPAGRRRSTSSTAATATTCACAWRRRRWRS